MVMMAMMMVMMAEVMVMVMMTMVTAVLMLPKNCLQFMVLYNGYGRYVDPWVPNPWCETFRPPISPPITPQAR